MIGKYDKRVLTELSYYYYEELSKYNGKDKILFYGIEPELLKEIVFKKILIPGDTRYELRKKWSKIYNHIDFSNISFDDVDIIEISFKGSKGVKINPQTVYKKLLCATKLYDTEIIGTFDGVNIYGTDFTGSKGAKINPQTVYNKNLSNSKLCDAEIIGSLDGVNINGTDFTGSKSYLGDVLEKIKKL